MLYRPSKSLIYSALVSLSLVYNTSVAVQTNETEILLAPKCFIQNSLDYNSIEYNKLSEITIDSTKANTANNTLVLFSVDSDYWETQLPVVYNFKDKTIVKQCGKYINLKSEWDDFVINYQDDTSTLDGSASGQDLTLYKKFLINHQKQEKQIAINKNKFIKTSGVAARREVISSLVDKVQKDRIESSLEEFSNFYNRASFTEHGTRAAKRVHSWLTETASNNKVKNFEAGFIETNRGRYTQPSVYAVLGKELPGKALIVGAHLDTVGGRMPGVDDDGSGSMAVLEAARVVLESGKTFNRPIYFMWYAAEEMGLVGSKVVAKKFYDEKVEIDSVIQLDTIGNRKSKDDETLWFLLDNVDRDFTDYLSDLAKNHVKVPVDYDICGYGCSDHASWNRYGFPAAAGTGYEVLSNRFIHTGNDTFANISLDNLANYSKLALAYIGDRGL